MDSAPSAPYAGLDQDLAVDVAVVGGGIAGLCTAWELAKSGRQVAVLEAGRIAAGVTGNTTAKVTALHTLIYDSLAQKHGPQTAAMYARSQQDAIEHIVATVAALGIDCDLERLPAYTYTGQQDQVEKIRAEAEAAARAGLAASFVTETGLPFPVAAAVRVDEQAQFHPRRYLLAIAQAITANGGQIFEHTRITGLDEGTPCRLTTETGTTVTAADVVVATHYPVFDRAMLFTRLVPHRELVIAAPVPASADPAGMYITPDGNTRSVRTSPYAGGQRLLIVTGESFTPGEGDVTSRYEALRAWARDRFGVTEPAYRWAAQDNRTSDQIPYIGPLHAGAEHTWVAAGFGGWGMTNAVVASRLIAESLAGRPPQWAGIYDPRRLKVLAEAGPVLKAQAQVVKHFVGDRLRRAPVGTPAELAPGQAAVMRVQGERCAVYRDQDGTLHAVSATCTHLGCLVAFNDAETAWECPCHGSRFAVDGTVIQGPANRPLPPQPLNDTATA